MKIDIDTLKDISRSAGKAIMEIYQKQDFNIRKKEDNTLVTDADILANDIIVSGLEQAYPQVMIIAEESNNPAYELRKDAEFLWCVDPLDGTKGFVRQSGEFCVNIALLHKNIPMFGIIYAPFLQTWYYGGKNYGAFKQIYVNEPKKINVNNDYFGGLTIATSRNSTLDENDKVLASLDIAEIVKMGSAVKFGLIAEGKADLYYRKKGTMEWDTAAGQAIVEAAGGLVTDISGNPLKYNKEDFANPTFLCMASPHVLKHS